MNQTDYEWITWATVTSTKQVPSLRAITLMWWGGLRVLSHLESYAIKAQAPGPPGSA
jgi:hypothetical protein